MGGWHNERARALCARGRPKCPPVKWMAYIETPHGDKVFGGKCMQLLAETQVSLLSLLFLSYHDTIRNHTTPCNTKSKPCHTIPKCPVCNRPTQSVPPVHHSYPPFIVTICLSCTCVEMCLFIATKYCTQIAHWRASQRDPLPKNNFASNLIFRVGIGDGLQVI